MWCRRVHFGQREPTNVILKEEIAENMEATQSEATDKDDKDGVKEEQTDAQDATEQLPLPEEKAEEMEQPSEPQSNDVGFKKVFKFVGFKFTVKKDKTEKSEPVQLLTVKKEDQVSADGAGDNNEVKLEKVEEATQSEVTDPVEKTEEKTESEERKDESPPEKLAESPSEEAEGSKVAEVKKDPSKSPESPTALVSETSSPLRKFFTQGWAGFRKKTSFRKPKDDEQLSPERERQEQEKDGAEISVEPSEKEKNEEEKEVVEIPTETSEREKTEKEKGDEEKDVTDVPLQASEKEKTEKEEQEQTVAEIPTEVSEKEKRSEKDRQEQERDVAETPEGTTLKEVTVLSEQPVLQETTVSVNKEPEGSFEEKIEQVKEYKITLEEKTEIYAEEKSELEASLSTEVFAEKSEGKMQEKSEPVAPLAMEVFDEKVETKVEAHVSTVEEKEIKAHEAELALDLYAAEQRPSSVPEQSFEGDADLKKVQPTDEVLKDKETVCKTENDLIKQTELVSEDVTVCKPPEGITNEVEMLSSQERAKVQGSPLKKLFTGTGLKKLSGKKHKGKREETKLGEPADQIQHLSDSPESPEEQKAESSASSPEESTEIPSVEKAINAIRASETEEGIPSDSERKRENVTPWASFKKMVTPKKRVRRPSESDKEEEIDKGKTATLSSTESAASENHEEAKENSEDLKLEKNTEEPKRKVDTSVSWEAFICVGSSKKRARKSSSSDEEGGQKPAQEGQKIEEGGENKDTPADTMLTSSQESDHGQGSSSPEQTGSPSEGEGVSTWESFKRLVTPRRKSKTKMEDKTEEPVTAASIEHSTSDGEPGKEESWVSFRKLMPGRRKKKSDGKLEQARADEAGETLAETVEEDSDVPAVVPLSEYEAAEREKIEAQMAVQADAAQEGTLEEDRAEKLQDALETDQSNEGLVHAVTVTVVEGERAVTSIEERSPSWISAAVTETIEQVKDEEKPTEQISEAEVIVEETVVVTKTLPEMRKDTSDDTLMSELELTSEAVTAREEATEVSCAEEATEVSLAEETTEMVSAVSQLPETPDTTEEVTPVQEVDGTEQNLEELNKHTREILEEVAERVKLSDEAQVIGEETVIEVVTQTAQEIELEIKDEEEEITVTSQITVFAEQSVKEQEFGGGDIQLERAETVQEKNEMEENALKEVTEISETCTVMKEHTGETTSLDILTDESQRQAPEHATVERHEEMSEEVSTAETSDSREREFYSSVTITPKAELEVEAEYVTAVKQHIAKEEGKLNLTELPTGETADEGDLKVDEAKVKLSEELKQVVDIKTSLEPECSHVPVSAVPLLSDITAVAVQGGREDVTPTLESKGREETVVEAVVQGEVMEAPLEKEEKDSFCTAESKSTGVITTQLHMQSEVTEVPEQSELEEARSTVEPTCMAETSPEASVQSEVTEDPLKKEVAETVLTVESERTEAVVTDVSLQREVPEVPVQSEVEDAYLTVETEHTKTIVMDIPMQTERAETAMQSEVEDSVPTSESKYSETIATEATMQTEADNAMPPLETKCPEKIETEAVLQSKEEDDVSTLESKCTEGITAGDSVQSEVPEVPVDRERDSSLGSKCSEAVVTEASVQRDISPKEVPVHGKREEHVEAKQMLLHTTVSSKDCETKKIESEQMLKMGKDFHDSGKLEIAHGDTVYSVQQEVVEPQEDMGSAIPEVESSEAQKASMPVTAASVEEQVISEMVRLMETTDEIVQAVASVPEKLPSEIVQDKSPSITHVESEKVDGQSIESQSTKIVLKIVQTAVDKLERTEKPMAVSIISESQQQIESTDRSQEGINISEIQKCVLADQQLTEGEETGVSKEQEIQQPSTKEKAPLEQTKDVSAVSGTSKERGRQDSVEIAAIPEEVLSESSGYQKPRVEISVSEDFTKKSVDTDQSELKKTEVKQTVEIQCISQQMHVERKEEHHSQSVEDVMMHMEEDVNSQDPTSHYPEMNQSQTSLALTD
ncbi:PREDICTED: A-kinase anchor protein 12 isoform X2 [Gavialis gangeticus]|uniref:A-kinase anchor protein 12 isoform X2 n=1 Tax=Gavialis gangeticus TaxID=94835 RepID=UPI00092F004B|nr:PREDICTED: A-kinase anchor protein 12 isoform X2 [Gavialis gangeticus]